MSETTPNAEQPAEAITPPSEETEERGGLSFNTVLIGSVVAFVGLYLLVFIIGLVAALIFDEGARNWFSYFRDLLEISLALTFITVIVGVGILVMQIARFVNLLRSEIKPISEDTRAAIKNVRTTTEFVQKNAVGPIIRFQAFAAGLVTFLREMMRISRILQRRPDQEQETTDDA